MYAKTLVSSTGPLKNSHAAAKLWDEESLAVHILIRVREVKHTILWASTMHSTCIKMICGRKDMYFIVFSKEKLQKSVWVPEVP